MLLRFDPEDALRGCIFDATGADFAPLGLMPPAVKTQHAEHWRRSVQVELERQAVQQIEWSYDWTFSTRWWGCPEVDGVALEGAEDPDGTLPMDLLTARDEFLWSPPWVSRIS